MLKIVIRGKDSKPTFLINRKYPNKQEMKQLSHSNTSKVKQNTGFYIMELCEK